MCSQMSNYQVYPLQNYKWACQVCLRRHCCLWVWRPSWTVWDPRSKKKGSLPLTWPWIFPNAQLYHRSPFSPEWLWQAASVVMALNFRVIAISKWWGMTRQPNREKKKSQREWNHGLRGGFFFFLLPFPKGPSPLLFLWSGGELCRVWGPNLRRQSATSHALVSGWVFVLGWEGGEHEGSRGLRGQRKESRGIRCRWGGLAAARGPKKLNTDLST